MSKTYDIKVGNGPGIPEAGGRPQLKLHVNQVGAVDEFGERHQRRPGEHPVDDVAVPVAGGVEQPQTAQGPGGTV